MVFGIFNILLLFLRPWPMISLKLVFSKPYFRKEIISNTNSKHIIPLSRLRLWLQVSLLGHVFVFGPNSGFSAGANQRQPSWTGIVRQTINRGPAIFWSFRGRRSGVGVRGSSVGWTATGASRLLGRPKKTAKFYLIFV